MIVARRKFLLGGAALIAAPGIVRAQNVIGSGVYGDVKAGGPPPAFSWTFVGSAASVGGGGNTIAFGGITVSSGLLIIVVTAQDTLSTPSVASVTFGATSLAKAVDDGDVDYANSASIWYGVVTGGTQTVSVTTTNTITRASVSYGIITGATATPTATQTAFVNPGTTPNVTIAVPTGGIAITAFNADRTLTGTLSGATLDDQLNLASTSGQLLTTHTTTTGSVTVQYTGTNAITSVVSAAWGP